VEREVRKAKKGIRFGAKRRTGACRGKIYSVLVGFPVSANYRGGERDETLFEADRMSTGGPMCKGRLRGSRIPFLEGPLRKKSLTARTKRGEGETIGAGFHNVDARVDPKQGKQKSTWSTSRLCP